MKFPQDFIERVREATNIVDIINPYVQLRRGGRNYVGLCPFHNEKSPSFSVSEEKQVYHCFSCKASGNSFTFLINHLGLSFPEAVEHLARKAAIPLPRPTSPPAPSSSSSSSYAPLPGRTEGSAGADKTLRPSGLGAREQKDLYYKINRLAADFFHAHLIRLAGNDPVIAYLRGRGIDGELAKTHRLGYAPNSWTELVKFFEARRVPMAHVEHLGLAKARPSDKGGGHYDLFRHRLMFPIVSPAGDHLGFGGRVLDADHQPKYLNSPESQIFHKGKLFYGLANAAKFARVEGELIIVEGYMDWLALVKAGISNVVATLGTALTSDHARLAKRYSTKVLVLFDGDNAGKSAAKRSLPVLLSEGVLARGVFLPDEMDPDEYLKECGPDALRHELQSAKDLFDLIATDEWMHKRGSPIGRIELIDQFSPVLAQIKDFRLRRLYVENLAQLADVDRKLVEQSIKSAGVRGSPLRTSGRGTLPTLPALVEGGERGGEGGEPQRQAPEPLIFDLNKAPRAEVELLNVVLMKEVYLKEAIRQTVGEELGHPGCRTVFARIAEEYRQMPSKFDTLSALLADYVRPVETITRHLAEPYTNLDSEAADKLLQDCIKRVKTNFLRLKSKELVSSLSQTGSAHLSDQLEQIMNIHNDRRSLNRDTKT